MLVIATNLLGVLPELGVVIAQTAEGVDAGTGTVAVPIVAVMSLICLAAGLYTWAFGFRSIKRGAGILGVLLGGALAAQGLVPLLAQWSVPGWLVILIGAIAGLVLGLVLFKGMVALTCAALASAVVPLATLVVLDATHPAERSADEPSLISQVLPGAGRDEEVAREPATVEERVETVTREAVRREIEALVTQLRSDPAYSELTDDELQEEASDRLRRTGEVVREATVESVREARRFAEGLWAHLMPHWERLPNDRQVLLLLVAVGGFVGGGGFGLLMPKSAATVASALVGAAAALGGAVSAAEAFGTLPAFADRLNPWHWTALWAVLAGLGVVVQVLIRRSKRKARSGH